MPPTLTCTRIFWRIGSSLGSARVPRADSRVARESSDAVDETSAATRERRVCSPRHKNTTFRPRRTSCGQGFHALFAATHEVPAQCKRRVKKNFKFFNPNSEVGMGSARVARASSGVAPELLSHTTSGLLGATKFVGRCFRRDAENHTPEACAPQNAPSLPSPTSEFGFKTRFSEAKKLPWRCNDDVEGSF
jgi:hypothetical protein